MRISGVSFSVTQLVSLGVYYLFAQYLPASYSRCSGKKIRYFLCKRIFKSCGCNVQ